MIGVRSITLGLHWDRRSQTAVMERVTRFMGSGRATLAARGIAVRTCRLAVPVFDEVHGITRERARSIFSWLAQVCETSGIRWFCVPFREVGASTPIHEDPAFDLISRHDNAFVHLMLGSEPALDMQTVSRFARFVKATSRLTSNGIDNFRVGVSANVAPHTPFFPFAAHSGEDGFTLALETVPILLRIVSRENGLGITETLAEMERELEGALRRVTEAAAVVERDTGLQFFGVDASLAPFPDGTTSVARIVECLGVDGFGAHGTVLVTSLLTRTLRNAITASGTKAVGFNGVMYSVLEDDYLARRNNQRDLSIDNLLLYSTVCGCGLDMVPVPGDIPAEEIAAIIADVAALSITLRKPLGLRLLPIPTGTANERTEFNHDFLVDTRIIPVRNRGLHSLLGNTRGIPLLVRTGLPGERDDGLLTD